MPLTVTSAWRAPAWIPARVLAVASPRSLWQWTETTTFSMPGVWARIPRDQLSELLGDGVADGVRDVERRGPGLDRLGQDHVQELRVGAPGVLGREFHVVAERPGISHHLGDALDDLLPVHLELVLHVDVGGGQEGVDAGMGGALDRLPGLVDVAPTGARQPGNDRDVRLRLALGRVAHLDRDAAHGLQVVRGGGGEAGLDDVHAQAGERAGHFQLFGRGHGRAGRLLAVAQGGVENANVVLHN